MTSKIISKIKWIYYGLLVIFIKRQIVGKKSNDSFLITINSSHELRRAYTFYDKEPEMIDWIESLLKYQVNKDFVFWDIGANIGIYALFVAKKYKEAKVFCFEPEANNFSALCNNILLNKFKNVKPFMIGLSNKTGYDFLQISVMSPGAGAASIAAPYKYTTQATVFEQGIGITKADDIVNNNLFPVPNFIKIDVDGHERQILEGSSELFKMTELKAIMLELEFADPDDLNQVISQMKNFGFNLSKISDWKEFAKGYTIQNFLFEKK